MKHCLQCGNEIPNHKKFCNSSCAATFNNKRRKPRSEESKKKTSESLKQNYKINPQLKEISRKTMLKLNEKREYTSLSKSTKQKISTKLKKKPKVEIVGEFSKLYRCTCKHCNTKMLLPSPKHLCDACKDHHTNLRMRYRFSFNVYHYPNLFDLNLLNTIGWYAPRGKSGKWNPDGLSRDHKVSVAEAIKNNYDPYYITHPLNCDLIPHIVNNKKNDKSSISYSLLKQQVDEYDNQP